MGVHSTSGLAPENTGGQGMTALAPDTLSTGSQVHSSQVQHRTGTKGMTSGKLAERQKAKSLRATFKDDWQAFVRSEFDDVTHVAYEFGCDPDTAENWFEGRNAPQGSFVRWAFFKWPSRAAKYLTPGGAAYEPIFTLCAAARNHRRDLGARLWRLVGKPCPPAVGRCFGKTFHERRLKFATGGGDEIYQAGLGTKARCLSGRGLGRTERRIADLVGAVMQLAPMQIAVDYDKPEEFAAKLRVTAACHPVAFVIPAKFGLMVAQRLDAADRLIGDMAALQAERAAMRADIDAALVLHEKTKALSADGKLMAARALRRLCH